MPAGRPTIPHPNLTLSTEGWKQKTLEEIAHDCREAAKEIPKHLQKGPFNPDFWKIP